MAQIAQSDSRLDLNETSLERSTVSGTAMLTSLAELEDCTCFPKRVKKELGFEYEQNIVWSIFTQINFFEKQNKIV